MQPKVKQTEKEKRNLKLENENENKLLKEHTKNMHHCNQVLSFSNPKWTSESNISFSS